ncbi:cyclase family protein [Conexibacter woesei]|uniref:Cyclase family protein n=1 Tax=Conexibacter woesei (strain DSM 14684 / CCUG 47730 / CIP 108061 / JCM 11494 / NBRC 100937 / ID131577) TaxID=469383 RepID=D3F991_CONWI|nr:cyclase family protein [Conexibacter woesei]ADB49058.1 cyclase family protein [Conexibacter woesei DSM 14684]
MRLVDLTRTLRHGMLAFPGEPTVGFVPFSSIERDDVEMWQVSLFSQVGTHLDAPSHFLRDGRTIEAVDLARCVGPATVVDARELPTGEIDGEVLAPYADALARTGRALIRTDWDVRAAEREYWTDFPSMTVGAAERLVELGVVFLGLDTPSPHRTEFRLLHEALFVNEMVVAECLVRLAELEHDEVFLMALPLPLEGLDGSPARIVAIDEQPGGWPASVT